MAANPAGALSQLLDPLSRTDPESAMTRLLHRLFALTTWLTFPLMFSFLFPKGTRIALVVAWGALGAWTLVRRRTYSTVHLSLAVALALMAYSGYLLALVVATGLHPSPTAVRGVTIALAKVAYAVFLLFVLNARTLRDLWAFYSRLMAGLALAATLLTVLIAFGMPPPLLAVYEQPIPGAEPRLLSVYPLGFALSTLPGLPFPVYRVQSFSDEPGSFAMAILPAIYWSSFERRRLRVAVLLLGLIMTFSVGGLLCVATVALIRLTRHVRFSMRRVLWGSAAMIGCSVVAAVFTLWPPPWLATYLVDKFGTNSTSSAGVRVHQLEVAWNLLRRFPEGVGPGAAMLEANSPISIGTMKAVAEAGVLGGIAYVTFLSLLAWAATRSVRNSLHPMVVALAAGVITNLLMAFQRMQADQSFWHFFVIVSFIVSIHLTAPRSKRTSDRAEPSTFPSIHGSRPIVGDGE